MGAVSHLPEPAEAFPKYYVNAHTGVEFIPELFVLVRNEAELFVEPNSRWVRIHR